MSDDAGSIRERIDAEELRLAMTAAGIPPACPDCSAEWLVRGRGARLVHDESCPNARGVTRG